MFDDRPAVVDVDPLDTAVKEKYKYLNIFVFVDDDEYLDVEEGTDEVIEVEEGAEIDGYIKGAKHKKNVRDEEDKDIEEIIARPELGKPTLVKDNKKEVV